jgi:Zn-dependent protease/CBS domain-containing protein
MAEPASGPRQNPVRTQSAGLPVGRFFGVPVYLSPSWLFIALLITITYSELVEQSVDGISTVGAYAVAFTFAVLLAISLLAHELGHTAVSLAFGLPVKRVVIFLLGGVSEIEKEPTEPSQEYLVAVAGPLVSLVLAAGSACFLPLTDPGSIARTVVFLVVWSNLAVAVFNLLPGLPLDGGRVVSAGVWRLTGRRHTGTMVAAWIGRFVAVVVFLLPFVIAAVQETELDIVDVVWGALLGGFIWVGASQSLQQAGLQARLPGLTVRSLTRRAIPVAADLPLAEALRQAHEAGARAMVVVSAGGDPVGLVVEAAVRATPAERRPWVPVSDLSRRLEPGHRVEADLSGEALIDVLTSRPASEYLVVEANGDVYGVLATVDVERALTSPSRP